VQYLSVCSGIEAATVAWSPLGFEAVAFSEIDNFSAAVLTHHYPGVPNLGDMTKFKEWPDYEPDILVGGTPCQSFSVAGLRKGLADPRGSLMLTYLAIADRYQPEWIVWENVPGVLSSGSGRDFGTLLGALGQIGYGWAYRILDAQFFGVPQRRRRVFVVGHLGDWRRAAAVLFERHSLQRHPTPSRETGKDLAPCLSARTKGGGGLGTDFDLDGGLINTPQEPVTGARAFVSTAATLKGGSGARGYPDPSDGNGHNIVAQENPPAVASFWNGEQVTQTLDAVLAKGQMMPEKNWFPAVLVPDVTHSLRADGVDASEQRVFAICTAHTSGNGRGISDAGVSYTLERAQGQAVAFAQNPRDEAREMAVVGALASSPGMKQTSYIRSAMQVRRLTVLECERLQGFPDGYTQVPYRNKPAADGPRYKALGNSMAVPVMRWIGERIQLVDWLHS
jgi:DNA (cytosine-5)-methyltransferase 1